MCRFQQAAGVPTNDLEGPVLVLEPELVAGLLDYIEIVVEVAPQALWVSWSKLDHNELAEQEAYPSEHHRPLPKQRGL